MQAISKKENRNGNNDTALFFSATPTATLQPPKAELPAVLRQYGNLDD